MKLSYQMHEFIVLEFLLNKIEQELCYKKVLRTNYLR